MSSNATVAGGAGAFSVVFGTASLPYSITPYTITYAYAGDENLNAATNTATALTVNAAPLTITADNQSKTYGQVDPTLTVTYAGLTNGDTVRGGQRADRDARAGRGGGQLHDYALRGNGGQFRDHAGDRDSLDRRCTAGDYG